MVIAQGKFKHCQARNLNKEVCLSFNLPPYHILTKKFIPEIVADWIEKVNFFSESKKTPFQVL